MGIFLCNRKLDWPYLWVLLGNTREKILRDKKRSYWMNQQQLSKFLFLVCYRKRLIESGILWILFLSFLERHCLFHLSSCIFASMRIYSQGTTICLLCESWPWLQQYLKIGLPNFTSKNSIVVTTKNTVYTNLGSYSEWIHPEWQSAQL